ncbi:hypothetical protein WISP_19223 [Willisornis vidua]|uniref:Uncharacterized protein n=1 Tax=Willisornis vidua TaxID=1566151 RepID=A0ABQ9DPL7_9PASS|nr:hypothetical protein WISP_19223 [Willisornis vidua]
MRIHQSSGEIEDEFCIIKGKTCTGVIPDCVKEKGYRVSRTSDLIRSPFAFNLSSYNHKELIFLFLSLIALVRWSTEIGQKSLA